MRSCIGRRNALGRLGSTALLLVATAGCEPVSATLLIGIGLKELAIIAGVVVAKLAIDAKVKEAQLDHKRKMLVLKGNVGDKAAMAEIVLTDEQHAALKANGTIDVETPDGRKVSVVLGDKP